MSKKVVPTVCLVIDASIARAVGPMEAEDARSVGCREFLLSVRSTGHRMAFNPEMKAEWDRHQSGFARTWLTQMFSIGNVTNVPVFENDSFKTSIDTIEDKGIKNAIIKDRHLVETAFGSDRRVGSLDDTMRGHLKRMDSNCPQLGSLIWVNPTRKSEFVIAWIESGAPAQKKRTLAKFRV